MSILDYFNFNIKRIALAKSLAETTYPQQIQQVQQPALFPLIQFSQKDMKEASILGGKLAFSKIFPYTLEEEYPDNEDGSIYPVKTQQELARLLTEKGYQITQPYVSALFKGSKRFDIQMNVQF
jgi:hypothetical protein